MKILTVHNEYQHRGGEDVVVSNEQSLLRSHGHTVDHFSVSNHSIKTIRQKFETSFNATYSISSKHLMASEIERSQPDLVHVHNFFPLLTPSIYDACKEAGVPVVQTLHNYRLICPAALLMRNGHVCEDCLYGSAYQAVLHGCYRDSRLASIPVAHMVETHRRKNTWGTKVNRFIALTEFGKNRFVAAGFPSDKITVKPNFVPRQSDQEIFRKEKPAPVALFVGRLSVEKGIDTLLKAWKNLDLDLKIVGEGPLSKDVSDEANPRITMLGKKSAKDTWREMEKADFLILPSQCYEGFALVIVEAFANGLPVIVSGLGSLADIVKDGVTGLHFSPGNAEDLQEKVRQLVNEPQKRLEMSVNARHVYEEKYTPEENYTQLIDIYSMARA